MPGTTTPPASFARPANALVTGASRGIGLALVQALLGDSPQLNVFAVSRHSSEDNALGTIAADQSARLYLVDMDVTREASVSSAAAAVSKMTDQIDLIINCAGLLHDGADMRPEKRLAEVSVTNLQRSFAVNAIGPLLVAKHFHSLLPRRQRAVFANLSARVGSIGDNRLGGWYSYRASKAAQNMLTKNLSIELRRSARGIICIALHPGTVDTTLSQPFQDRVPPQRLFSPSVAARQLLKVIDELKPADNGCFFDWDGQRIRW
jgi:NAD(P)-dependent dehydrogenase (short-subunit alcohol dehydrogenase family)